MTTSAIQLQQVGPIAVAVIRRTVTRSELSRVVPESCGLVWKALKDQQVPAGRNIAIYWDGAIRLEVGAELTGSFTPTGTIARSATPGGTVVSATHHGPYGSMGETHAAIHEWCRGRGQRLAGPSWEIYGHWQDAWNRDASLIRTDVFYLATT